MWSRISNSWELVKASAAVLRADKELLLFPLASTLATIMVMIVFAVPMFLANVFDNVADSGDPGVAGYVIAFLFYVTMYFVVIFANTALVGAALIRLNGGDPTLRDGINIAMARVDKILGYAIIAATVGMVLRYIREKGGIIGQIFAWVGDVAWNLATYLVVPVLVSEDIGPIEAVKRSTRLLKDTWGEQVVGNFSIGLVFFLIGLAAVLLVGIPVIALAALTESVIVVVLGVGLVVLVIAVVALVGSTLNGIYTAALYRYATQSAVDTQFFPPGLIEGAFKPKRG